MALRIFNAFGPGQSLPVSHAPVVPRFLQQAMTGGSIIIFGDGKQTRDYVYVDDAVNALMAALTAEGINRTVINVGSGRETSVIDLVSAIERVTGRPINIITNAQKGGGVPRLQANIERAGKLLNFRPEIDLETGLRLTLERDPRFGPQ